MAPKSQILVLIRGGCLAGGVFSMNFTVILFLCIVIDNVSSGDDGPLVDQCVEKFLNVRVASAH